MERAKVDIDFVRNQGYRSYDEVEQVTRNLHQYFEIKPSGRLINQRYAGQIHSKGARYNALGFPVFEPPQKVATVELEPSLYVANGEKQMKEATKKLAKQIRNNPLLIRKLTQNEILNLHKGIWPRSKFTWHHHEVSGRMELIEKVFHDDNKHTGGVAIWGEGKR